MNSDKDDFYKALDIYDIDIKAEQYKPTTKTIDFLREAGLKNEFIEFFKELSFKRDIDFDGITFRCVNKIRTENIDVINKEIYKQGYLIVGSGLNGDPIVLNTNTMTTGYIYHSKLWSDNGFETIESIFEDLKVSIGKFYFKAAMEDDFPIDAYEAHDYILES